MNYNPNAQTVVCFGDSNTWSRDPGKYQRLPADVRWPGQLQQKLGNDFYVIEEGMDARNTDIEHDKPGRSGKSYLLPCVQSHSPFDVIVIMLGTNDLKTKFARSAKEVATALDGLVSLVQQYAKNNQGQAPHIILVSPVCIDIHAPRFDEFFKGKYDQQSMTTSKELAGTIAPVAKTRGCAFLDANTVARVGDDGVHLSVESHGNLSDTLATLAGSLAAQ